VKIDFELGRIFFLTSDHPDRLLSFGWLEEQQHLDSDAGYGMLAHDVEYLLKFANRP
jgi:hypothetical protein